VEITRLGGSECGSAVHTKISTQGSFSPYLPNDIITMLMLGEGNICLNVGAYVQT
jgi:hypothetical protein